MKKTILTVGTLVLLASPSLFAVEATKTQSKLTTQLQSQQRLHNGTGQGGKKQYKYQYKHQNKYQGTNKNGQGQGNMSGKGQGKETCIETDKAICLVKVKETEAAMVV